MKKKKRKYKLKKRFKLLLLLIILIIGGIFVYKDIIYKKTNTYKLLSINYTESDVKIITSLNQEQINKILEIGYDKNIVKLIGEKYFIFNNLDRYLAYIKDNNKTSITDVVALVNVGRDSNYYENTRKTDTSKGTSMLVNKYNLLSSDYKDSSIVNVSLSYSYDDNSLNRETYEAFKTMANEAKKAGYTILIVSSYRTYDYQNQLWEEKKDDDFVARAGASEHQTGYAVDVADYFDKNDSFKDTKAYEWMINNSYKYGFILRYPLGKESITGYQYEAWHYRYLGKELATKVYNEGITFDEYYAYYLDN